MEGIPLTIPANDQQNPGGDADGQVPQDINQDGQNADNGTGEGVNTDDTQEVDGGKQGKEDDTVFDRKYVEQLRNENASHRTKAKDLEGSLAAAEAEKNELIQKIGRAFGFVEDEDDKQADAQAIVEQVTKERDEYHSELRKLREENALSRAMGNVKVDGQTIQVDPDLTLAVIKGNGALADLDPTDEDYVAQVARVVSETVAAHPQLRAQAAPRSSGNAPTPPNNSGGTLSEEDLIRMQNAGEYEEINQAFAEGRFKFNH